MNFVETQLFELLGVAEMPLYSVYRWLNRRVDSQLALAGFLDLLQEGLIARRVVTLTPVDVSTGLAERLPLLPPGLARTYGALGHADEAFDPFGLSLAIRANPNPTGGRLLQRVRSARRGGGGRAPLRSPPPPPSPLPGRGG